jgi:hypothetical protein
MAPYTIKLADKFGVIIEREYETWTDAMSAWSGFCALGSTNCVAIMYGANADDGGNDLTEDEEAQL